MGSSGNAEYMGGFSVTAMSCYVTPLHLASKRWRHFSNSTRGCGVEHVLPKMMKLPRRWNNCSAHAARMLPRASGVPVRRRRQSSPKPKFRQAVRYPRKLHSTARSEVHLHTAWLATVLSIKANPRVRRGCADHRIHMFPPEWVPSIRLLP